MQQLCKLAWRFPPNIIGQTSRMCDVSSLPVTILVPLFMHGQALYHGNTAFNPPFEVLVSHVARHWRYVAIGTSALWEFVRLRPDKSLHEIQTYCDRSQRRPIRVLINTFLWNGAPFPPDVLDLVSRNVWREATVHFTDTDLYSPLLRCLAEKVAHDSHLKHLSISVTPYRSGDSPSIMPLSNITILPSLRVESLRLFDCSVHLFRPDNVTSLLIKIGDVPPINYLRTRAILSSTPSLRRLSIYGSDPFSLETWPRDATRSISLPNLDSLALRFTSGPMFSRILTHVNAPLLRTLYLKELQEHDLDDFHSYSRLTSVYFPKLASLTFDDFDLSALAYSKLAGVFPNLSEFNLIHSDSERAMLSVLLMHRPYAHIWPRLQVLRVPLHTVDEQQLYTIISLRSSLGMPLERICLDVPRPSGLPTWITQLRHKIQVEVIYHVGYWSGDGHAGEEQ